ncbi:HK97 family phage prohead protease [Gemmata sp. G18]|uniref:HK97 family phage prohead protease n=1 Tax=Gemmata palustris TaxID=2822762 RepID=A0ABS5BP30_9BACT|nr:HK97 family phage prohead protease [Gemmata palustris]MBP3955406.1 HK97 family phage prohead protease [Gemmata palustris]
MNLETKRFAIDELKAAEADDGTRTIEGLGSVFGNTDSYGEIVMPGAFAESIAKRKPAMLWQHRSDMPIGVWDEVEETKKGLRLKGRILTTQAGNDAYLLAKAGALTGLSIGFTTIRDERDPKKGVRKLLEVELYEVSLVTFPANEKATITNVKSRPDTIRAFEEYLREGGFSQKDATTVALHGFKALTTQGEPDEEVETNLRDLRDALTSFRI